MADELKGKARWTFDPEGVGYDYESARKAGLKPDETGHWPSREPKSGLILKGKKHDTWGLTEEGESKAGYEIYKGEEGRYYSRPMSKFRKFKEQQEAGPNQ